MRHSNHGPVLTRMLGDTGSLIFVIVLIALTVAVPLCNVYLPEASALHVTDYTVALIGKYLTYALLAVAIPNEACWRALQDVMGDPEWARNPAWQTQEGRRTDHDAIDQHLEAWLRTQGPDEALARLLEAGIPKEGASVSDASVSGPASTRPPGSWRATLSAKRPGV